MNETVNIFLLVDDKFMPEIQLKQPGCAYSASGPLLKTKKEKKNLYRLEIQILFTEMTLIKLVFNMIWLTTNQNI